MLGRVLCWFTLLLHERIPYCEITDLGAQTAWLGPLTWREDWPVVFPFNKRKAHWQQEERGKQICLCLVGNQWMKPQGCDVARTVGPSGRSSFPRRSAVSQRSTSATRSPRSWPGVHLHRHWLPSSHSKNTANVSVRKKQSSTSLVNLTASTLHVSGNPGANRTEFIIGGARKGVKTQPWHLRFCNLSALFKYVFCFLWILLNV